MSAVIKRCAAGAMAVAVMFLAGCSPATPPVTNDADAVKKPAARPEPVTAKTAFYPMDTAAHSWATDVVFLGLASKEIPGFVNDAGKAAMWEATFASPSLHKYRADTYAIITVLPGIHKGASAGFPAGWGGPTHDVSPIDTDSFSVDSDAAYKAAVADTDVMGYLKKNPEKKLASMQLGNVAKLHALVWYLTWGDKANGYGVYVDATSGKVIKK